MPSTKFSELKPQTKVNIDDSVLWVQGDSTFNTITFHDVKALIAPDLISIDNLSPEALEVIERMVEQKIRDMVGDG